MCAERGKSNICLDTCPMRYLTCVHTKPLFITKPYLPQCMHETSCLLSTHATPFIFPFSIINGVFFVWHRPHFLIAVPRLYDSIHEGIKAKFAKESAVKRTIIAFFTLVSPSVDSLSDPCSCVQSSIKVFVCFCVHTYIPTYTHTHIHT